MSGAEMRAAARTATRTTRPSAWPGTGSNRMRSRRRTDRGLARRMNIRENVPVRTGTERPRTGTDTGPLPAPERGRHRMRDSPREGAILVRTRPVTILVTGATGTLGKPTVARLRTAGHDVRSLSRRSGEGL